MESIEMPAEKTVASAGDHRPCRVLLVEDNEVNVMVATELLGLASRKVGMAIEIVIARSARDARAMWVDSNPSLVVLDVNLPDGRGDEKAH